MSFEQKKREPLLEEQSFDWFSDYLANELLPNLYQQLNDPRDQDDRANLLRRLASAKLEYAILHYSAGAPIEQIRGLWPSVLEAFEDFLDDPNANLTYVDLAIQDYYVEALWLLSLTKLLGFSLEDVKRVADFYAADESNDGADDLFELVCGQLGCSSFLNNDGVIHEKPYLHLLHCVEAQPAERPGHMRAFLKHWFKDQSKECGGFKLHIKPAGAEFNQKGFVGYWAFEAALVTYLWDIDDTTYRDMPYYPRDLVDYARTGHANDPAAESAWCR